MQLLLLNKLTKLFTIIFVSFLLVGCRGIGSSSGSRHSEVKLKTVIAGSDYSFALSDNGKVYAAGDNYYGQLGLRNATNRKTFTEVAELNDKNITAITAGYYHSLALSDNGKVYAAGYNYYGQLGLGDNVSRNVFTEVTDLVGKNIVAVSAKGDFSLALSKDGKVYAAGRNDNGELGLGDKINRNIFTKVASLNSKNIIIISVGVVHSMALSNDGKVYATGWNISGQLGLSDSKHKTSRKTFTEVSFLSD
ncbi:MAG: hypothetical protein LBP54_05825 [Campylobacteraceae bacterium]|jgi:alpha-tubulin suppressor-like RCC1 family protein|nr:hypothetical protein [Campylobacteraceae bacterium]